MLPGSFPSIPASGSFDPPSLPEYHRVLRAGRTAVVAAVASTVTYLGVCIAALVVYSVVFPPLTGIQLQRNVEAVFTGSAPGHMYAPIPLSRMDGSVPHAVVAAEDSRFFVHWGIDWEAVDEAIEEYRKGEGLRGGSTITQQLVKNLFMTTHSTFLRKALEVPLTYAAELLLSKRRILELYLNVLEWGPSIYGAEPAAQYYYGVSAADLSRAQAAALAACIPNPRVRRPATVGWYQPIILRRMKRLGPLPLPSTPSGQRTRPAPLSSDPSKTDASREPSVTDAPSDSPVIDSLSSPDSLVRTDIVPTAESLTPRDTVPPSDRTVDPDHFPATNDTSGTENIRARPSDSLREDENPAPDSTGTP